MSSSNVCVVGGRFSQQTWVQVFQGASRLRYDVFHWSPLKPDCPTLLPEEIPEGERSWVAGNGPASAYCTDVDGAYMSHRFPRTVAASSESALIGSVNDADRVLWFAGQRYSCRYIRGGLPGGASALLEGCLDDAIARMGLSDEPQLWVADQACSRDKLHLLMWVPPTG